MELKPGVRSIIRLAQIVIVHGDKTIWFLFGEEAMELVWALRLCLLLGQ
jgi:hypothetical protein